MTFYNAQKKNQIDWWEEYSKQPNWREEKTKWGTQNNVSYPHISKGDWLELVWEGIETELPLYLGRKIHKHSGVRNLLSSWTACANLYFPANCHREFKNLLSRFLSETTNKNIIELVDVELEFSLDGELSPNELLGEKDGERGSGQTSPDVAFIVRTPTGVGLILTECKYTEHSFYRCSARRKEDRGDKPGNLNPEKCLQPAATCDYLSIPCQQQIWGRKYLNHFTLTPKGKQQLKRCPAATAGYQLVRQQALANGIYSKGKYDFVISSVSFDERNDNLIRCLRSTGIEDFRTDWNEIYVKGAEFLTWHHQDWVSYVRENSKDPFIADWLIYMNKRYGY
jgi:hypothetical protein